MHATVSSGAVLGIEGYLVQVEVDTSKGLPSFQIAGLPDGAVREARLRLPAAFRNSGLSMPKGRITVNLAPASIRKDGTSYDLPIAVGVIASEGWVPAEELAQWLLLGELSLDGEIRAARGALPIAALARETGARGVILPAENALEAAVVSGIEVIPVRHLTEVLEFFRGSLRIAPAVIDAGSWSASYGRDFADVVGQERPKRGLEIAAAGGHNVLLVGPPGSGKSMLASRVPSILPPPSFDEALETSKIYSVVGMMPADCGLLAARPFRAPHHTISDVGIIGGGSGVPRPGEISLAHNGVLFLDELPEFRRQVLEVLRQPLEDGHVNLTRSLVSLTYPADVVLIAAMNPCPCGFYGTNARRRCTCSLEAVKSYRGRLSGPLLDRIDLHIEVPALSYSALRDGPRGESSAEVRERVENSRALQVERMGRDGRNSRMSPAQIEAHCAIGARCHELLEAAVDRLGLSVRGCTRVLKVARTIADLDGCVDIDPVHIAEAISFRTLDRALATEFARTG